MADETEKELATDEAIQAAMMGVLEQKLDAFMGRADLSDSPPEDKVAIRAGFFLGVTAGMSIASTVYEPPEVDSRQCDHKWVTARDPVAIPGFYCSECGTEKPADSKQPQRKCEYTAGTVRCCLPGGHEGGHRYKCAGDYCPGLGWPASNTPHPTSCAIERLNKPSDTDDHDKDCDLFKQVRGIGSPKMHCTCK